MIDTNVKICLNHQDLTQINPKYDEFGTLMNDYAMEEAGNVLSKQSYLELNNYRPIFKNN